MPNNHLETQEDSRMEPVIEFFKKTWILLLGLIAIFGGAYSAFVTGGNKKVMLIKM
jgi:hypothetical protein